MTIVATVYSSRLCISACGFAPVNQSTLIPSKQHAEVLLSLTKQDVDKGPSTYEHC